MQIWISRISPAFSYVTRCRSGYDVHASIYIRNVETPTNTRTGKVFTGAGGSKWLCRWAVNKSAVRKSGYALLCVRLTTPGPRARYHPRRRWICLGKISGKTRDRYILRKTIASAVLFFFVSISFSLTETLRLLKRRKVADVVASIYLSAWEGAESHVTYLSRCMSLLYIRVYILEITEISEKYREEIISLITNRDICISRNRRIQLS